MTIIVFLIDTSASMNQRTFIGARPTLLDIAKGAVESFVKLRQRNPESRFDRYMLFTSEEIPNNIKAGWKENLATFMNELKNVKATGLSTIGPAIKNIFDVLNINRMQSGIDTYGSGRSPFFLEPSVIVCITDGGKLSSSQGVQDDIFPLPKSNQIPGAELTREIYRWDQRLFGLVLRLTGTPTPETMGIVPSDHSPLDKLCEQTGGRSYAVRTHRMFQQCIESLVQKVQSGVVINFEKIGPDPQPTADGKDPNDIIEIDKENQQMNIEPPICLIQPNGSGGSGILGSSAGNWPGASPNTPPPSYIPSQQNPVLAINNTALNISSTAWHNCRKMIYVPRPPHRGGSHNCFWPIPESYWPDSALMSLPARSAHPNLKFTCTSQEPMVIDNLPFDKYELEPSPLTQFILSRKQPTTCWQVFIANSSKNSDVGHPFGYLKASTTKPCVNLFVMPYNYPVLLPLLDDLFKVHRMKPAKDWRTHFENYLRTMPSYYATPLKRALERMGVSNLIADKFDVSLSFQVMSQLKKLKNQAKIEYEKVCAEVEKRVNQNNINSCGISNGSSMTIGGTHEGIKVLSRRPLGRHLTSNHLLTGNGKFDNQKKLSSLRDQVNEYQNFTIYVRENEIQPQVYRNPFDISRLHLIDQLARMRANFLQQSLNHLLTDRGQDQLHCKPISQMGNYQDYLKKLNPPLREIESAPMRQHMFGNPFKIDKRMSMMVDEADVDLIRGSGGATPPQGEAGRGTKRSNTDPPLGGARNSKRRKGPIPPELTLQRLVSPSPSPPSSPSPHLEDMSEILSPLPLSPLLPPQPHPTYSVHMQLPVPLVPELPVSPIIRPDPPISPVSTLSPSPAAIIPGYLHQVSPPGSPAPYPRMDSSAHSGFGGSPYPIVNGDIDQQFNEMKQESDSEDEREEDNLDVERLPRNEFEAHSPPQLEIDIDSPYILENNVEDRNGILNETDHIMSRRVDVLVENNGMNHLQDTPQTRQSNNILLLSCYKEVKRPGREYAKLLSKLSDLQGSNDSRIHMMKKIMSEALRFKRHSLVRLLMQQMEALGNGISLPFDLVQINQNSIPKNIVLNGHKR